MKTLIMFVAVLVGVFFANFSNAQTIEFEVKKGDNFWKLSKQYNVKHSVIIILNKNKLRNPKNPNLIYPGQKFVVEIADAVKAPVKSSVIVSNGDNKEKKVENFTETQSGMANAATTRSDEKSVTKKVHYPLPLERILMYTMVCVCLSILAAAFLIMQRNRSLKEEMTDENIQKAIRHEIFNNECGEVVSMSEISKNDSSGVTVDKKEVGTKIKNSFFAIRDSKEFNDDTVDRCFIGIDAESNIHCIGGNLEISGSYDKIARFVVMIYGEKYNESVAYMDKMSFAKIFSLRPLRSVEKIKLEDEIDKELHGLKT